jgi:hypothetical protein
LEEAARRARQRATNVERRRAPWRAAIDLEAGRQQVTRWRAMGVI